MKNPLVSIIILNWNGWQDTIECLESLYQINYPKYNVIIVDNHSTDNSITKIKEYAEGKIKVKSDFFDYDEKNKPIKLVDLKGTTLNKNIKDSEKLIIIKNETNYGFAEGNNIGIKFSLNSFNPEFVLLLNNDTVVDKDFLKELVNIGKMDESIGIVGPKIYYYDKPKTIWCIGGKISWKLARGTHIGTNELDKGQYKDIKEVDYASGSAFLIKKEVLKKIGFMDKNFFLYFEETDFSIRASKAGYNSFYAPKAKIWHKVSSSTGGIRNKIGLYYITRNRWLFMKKWANKTDFIFFIIYQIIGALILPLFLSIVYRNLGLFKAYYKGLFDGLKT